MASTSQLRAWWDDWRCAKNRMVPLHLFDTYVGTVPPSTVAAYRLLEKTLTDTGYHPDSVWTYNCRTIAGTTNWSLHSYGIAVDIDPAQNPYSTGDPFAGKFTRPQIEAVEALTVDGQQLWTWGGRWRKPDRMHFQLNVPPDQMRLDYQQVYDLAIATGLDHTQAVVATAIAKAESGLWPNAKGDTTITTTKWGPSIGLWQIRSLNVDAGTGRTRDETRLTDPTFNAQSMHTISNGGTYWRPWSVWLHNTYLQWVDDIEKALNSETTMFVKKGDKGPAVEYWQRRLVRLGANISFTGGPAHGIDGDYGSKTAAAVAEYVDGSDGNQIGPFEAEQLDAIAGTQGRPGDPGPPGPQGPQGPTGPAGTIPDDILITIPPITVTGIIG